MKVVIIEDEPLTAEDLASALQEMDASIQVVAQLESVLESVKYFEENEAPDLIFSDIQLSDGLSFELFKKVKIASPVIFCTAYDEYAIQAFRSNGIDYIMKPFSRQTVADALHKYDELKSRFSARPALSYETILDLLGKKEKSTQASVLVYYKDQILPVKMQDVAMFYIHNEMTHLKTFKGQDYVLDDNLDKLDQVTGTEFYRINRQHLVNRQAIKSASRFFARKLIVSLHVEYKESIIVSKAKVSSFLEWLEGGGV